tara:strand:+ start:106 stop:516 length:411 start_codon:yes stop_codon:yes gene_type:complete
VSKKRKLKRALKTAALLGAAGLGAAALGRRKQNKTFLAEEGGARSILPQAKRMMNVAGKMAIPVDVNASPREIDALVRSYGINTRADNFGLPIPKASMMASPGLNTGAFDIGMKKGGRVKKGFAKKKKQANKMRKK